MGIDDITGKRFGMLTVLGIAGRKNKQIIWTCKCDCGEVAEMYRIYLTVRQCKSCGCLRKKNTHTRIYRIWSQMKSRCNNENNIGFKNYGNRGIKVCDRWNNFLNFKDDMSKKYMEHAKEYGEFDTTLERVDNEIGYSPENCKWATKKEQRRNMRNSKYYTYKGEVITAGEISDRYGILYTTFESRLRRGWTIDKIIETKVRPQYGGVKKNVRI